MAGWLFWRSKKRELQSDYAEAFTATLGYAEKYSATLGNEWFEVVSGDEPGTIVIGVVSSAGVSGARVVSALQASDFAGAIMDAVWADSMDTQIDRTEVNVDADE